jgi:hypothetical protein
MFQILWLIFHILTKSSKQIINDGVYNIILNENNYLNYQKNNLQISPSDKYEEKSN